MVLDYGLSSDPKVTLHHRASTHVLWMTCLLLADPDAMLTMSLQGVHSAFVLSLLLLLRSFIVFFCVRTEELSELLSEAR